MEDFKNNDSFNYWKLNKSAEALILIKNKEVKELTSICSISPFEIKENWLNYLVKLDDEEKKTLINRNCKLICVSTIDSTIKIMSEEQDEDFVLCFHIVDTNTHLKVNYDIKNVYSILKEEYVDETRYDFDDSEFESLYRDIVLIISTNNKIISCKIPLYFILTLFIKNKLLKLRKNSANEHILNINISNIKKTIWLYYIDNVNNTDIITCFNSNNVYPYILVITGEKSNVIQLCLVTLKSLELELESKSCKFDHPLKILSCKRYILEDKENFDEILNNGIGFYPLKTSYIWILTLKKKNESNIIENNDELKIEDLSENITSLVYILETNRNEIKIRGKLNISYIIDYMRILNIDNIENKEIDNYRELNMRIISSTNGPNGILCFDIKLRIQNREKYCDKVIILSLVFMPIFQKKTNGFNKYFRNIGLENENDINHNLNYSFGNFKNDINDNLNNNNYENIDINNENCNILENDINSDLCITTLCVIPNYVHKILSKHLDSEINENFPLVFCGLSNNEWRIYSLKNNKKKSQQKNKPTTKNDDIGFFILKGIHVLTGNEFSIKNQLENFQLKVFPSCWNFHKNSKNYILSVVASNSIGNIFSWCLEKKKFTNIKDKYYIEKKTDQENILPKRILKKFDKLNINNYHEKTKNLTNIQKKPKNENIFRVMDDHLKRIDEKLKKVQIQEEIISEAEKYQEKVKENIDRNKFKVKYTSEQIKNLVPECVNRSISPRKGCESCNYKENEKKLFQYKSKYNFDYKRYNGYYDHDQEYLFQLNNYFNINQIYNSNITIDSSPNNNLIYQEIIDYDRLCENWINDNFIDIQYDEIFSEE